MRDAAMKDAAMKDAGMKDAAMKDAGMKDAAMKDAAMSDEVTRQRRQISADREELGRTIQALAERVDVAARAREALSSARVRLRLATRRVGRTDVVLAAASLTAGAVALVSLIIWRRRR